MPTTAAPAMTTTPSQLPAPKVVREDGSVTVTWSALGTENGWMVELKCDEWDEPLLTPLSRCHTPSLNFAFKDAELQNIRCRVALRGADGVTREPSWSNWTELKRRTPVVVPPAAKAESEAGDEEAEDE